MGSFSSTPKIDNPDNADDDLIETLNPTTREELVEKCLEEIKKSGRPPLLTRPIRSIPSSLKSEETPIRILQWNVLSQSRFYCLFFLTDKRVLLCAQIHYGPPDITVAVDLAYGMATVISTRSYFFPQLQYSLEWVHVFINNMVKK